MKVFVALRKDIAPDIRLDYGGGEIGHSYILGIFSDENSAHSSCMNDLSTFYLIDSGFDEEIKDMTIHQYKEYRSDLVYSVESHELAE